MVFDAKFVCNRPAIHVVSFVGTNLLWIVMTNILCISMTMCAT
jgi:hypothetical protein